MPHIDWRRELDSFINEWHGQGVLLTPESQDSIGACLEQCEQAIVDAWREQSTPEEFNAILNAYPT